MECFRLKYIGGCLVDPCWARCRWLPRSESGQRPGGSDSSESALCPHVRRPSHRLLPVQVQAWFVEGGLPFQPPRTRVSQECNQAEVRLLQWGQRVHS